MLDFTHPKLGIYQVLISPILKKEKFVIRNFTLNLVPKSLNRNHFMNALQTHNEELIVLN